MPEIAGAVLAIVERDFGEDHVAVGRLQDQADGIAVTAEQHEVDAIGHRGGAQGSSTASGRAERRHGGCRHFRHAWLSRGGGQGRLAVCGVRTGFIRYFRGVVKANWVARLRLALACSRRTLNVNGLLRRAFFLRFPDFTPFRRRFACNNTNTSWTCGVCRPGQGISALCRSFRPGQPKNNPRSGKNALPFFPASDQDRVAQGLRPFVGAGTEEGTRPLRLAAQRECPAARRRFSSFNKSMIQPSSALRR